MVFFNKEYNALKSTIENGLLKHNHKVYQEKMLNYAFETFRQQYRELRKDLEKNIPSARKQALSNTIEDIIFESNSRKWDKPFLDSNRFN